MRVLFTTQPGDGHFHPLVPLARALVEAGHDVAVACPAAFGPQVRATGFAHMTAGFNWHESSIVPTFPALGTILPPPMRATYVMTYIFPYATARHTLADLLASGWEWRPDLVVRETEEYAGCVAAEHWGIPHASVQATATNTYAFRWSLAAPLEALRAAAGLPPDPSVEMLYRHLHLSALPRALLPPDEPVAPTAQFLRPVPFDRSGEEELPSWLADLPDQPVVYATLGTVFNYARPVFDAILAALRDEPLTLILTTGRNVDPASFAPQPPNIHIERYIPQTLLLPHCDLVLAHGGINTILAALMHGRPLVLLPQGADHPTNARRCKALGVGRSLVPGAQTPEAIREAVRAVLDDGSFRANAERLGAEWAALPGPEEAVQWLETLS